MKTVLQTRKRKMILLDLDRTLVDTERMRRDRLKILKKFGITQQANDRGMERRMSDGSVVVNPIWALSLIKNRTERAMAMKMVRAVYAVRKKYNYDGIEKFLARLARRYDLALFSYGHRPFQLLKFEQAAFGRYFKKIVITTKLHKRADLERFKKKHGDDVLLIDDSLEVAKAAREVGVKIIRVKKSPKDAAYFRGLIKKIEKLH